jgi:hypothetical protein
VKDLGRLLAVTTLLPGRIGGDPRAALGAPVLRHPDQALVQPDDVDVLAIGLRVTKATVTQLLGPALADQPIVAEVADVGPVDVTTALGAVPALQVELAGGLQARAEQVTRLQELGEELDRGADLGLLGPLLEGR